VVECLLSSRRPNPNSSVAPQKRGRGLHNWNLVTHTCNPSYSGGLDQDRGSRPVREKKIHKTPFLTNKKLGANYCRKHKSSPDQPPQKYKTLSQKQPKQKGLEM
jgi:hypothetical protein